MRPLVTLAVVLVTSLAAPRRGIADQDVVYAAHDLLSYAERCLENEKEWETLQKEPGAKRLKQFLSDNNNNSRTTGVSILHIVDGSAIYKRINDYGTRGQGPGWSVKEGLEVMALLRVFEDWYLQAEANKAKLASRALSNAEAAKALAIAFREPHVPIDVGVDLFVTWQSKYGGPDGTKALSEVDPGLGSASLRATKASVRNLQVGFKAAQLDPDFRKAWNKQAEAAQLLFNDQSKPILRTPGPKETEPKEPASPPRAANPPKAPSRPAP